MMRAAAIIELWLAGQVVRGVADIPNDGNVTFAGTFGTDSATRDAFTAFCRSSDSESEVSARAG